MIAKLIGGKNDGGLITLPFDESEDVLPLNVLIQYKQGRLVYELQNTDIRGNSATYEYSGIEDNANSD